jgi:hypothetical protein
VWSCKYCYATPRTYIILAVLVLYNLFISFSYFECKKTLAHSTTNTSFGHGGKEEEEELPSCVLFILITGEPGTVTEARILRAKDMHSILNEWNFSVIKLPTSQRTFALALHDEGRIHKFQISL